MKSKIKYYSFIWIKSEMWLLMFVVSQLIGALTVMVYEIYYNVAYADKFLEVMLPVYDNLTWMQQYQYLLRNGYVLIEDISSFITIISFLAFIIMFGGYFVIQAIKKKLTKAETSTGFVNIKEMSSLNIFKYIAIGLVLNAAISLIVPIAYKILPSEWNSAYQCSINTALAQDGLIMLLATGILAPIVEELTFRYGMLGTLKITDIKSKSFVFANMLQAFLFGVLHGNLIQSAYAFVLGYFFGYVDVKHKSIIPSIVMHILINLSSAVLYVLLKNSYTEVKEMIGMIIIGIVGFAMLCILFAIQKAQSTYAKVRAEA